MEKSDEYKTNSDPCVKDSPSISPMSDNTSNIQMTKERVKSVEFEPKDQSISVSKSKIDKSGESQFDSHYQFNPSATYHKSELGEYNVTDKMASGLSKKIKGNIQNDDDKHLINDTSNDPKFDKDSMLQILRSPRPQEITNPNVGSN